jgi:DNA-binding response OmpR family regulator
VASETETNLNWRRREGRIRILLIEDDAVLAAGLKASLEGEGFAVDWTGSGEDGQALGASEDYDSVILDLGLPDLPGLKILKGWRAAGVDHPVLVLTSRASWTEKVEGLNAGADDYLAKPFEAMEVAARLHALIRRRSGRADPVLRRGDIELRPAEGLVKVGGEHLELTGQELRILAYLMQRPGRIVSEQDIADHVYALDNEHQSNSIQVYISRLRRKLGRDTIKTFRGLGYRFS